MNDVKFKKALVTGGAGFIGSNLTEKLLDLGVETVSLDDLSAGKEKNIAHLKNRKNFRFVKCDVTDYDSLQKLFKESKFDIVFHQAASKKTVCLKDPRRDLRVNAEGTFNLLELSRDFGVEKFVHASTGSVYGEAQYHPQDEKHPLNPNSYYGVSKLAGERYVNAFRSLYSMNTTILRYFHVYGPRQDFSDFGGVVAIFASRVLKNEKPVIFGDGTQLRSFTYVGDVVNANILVAGTDKSTGEVYNCASGIKITIKELADKILNITGNNTGVDYDDWTPGDIKYFEVENKKLKSLGFSFETAFETGLLNTIDWLKSL